jgi:hypothetical protein
MRKNILIFSYYANMPGACQAEWLDDKIDSLMKANYEITTISSNSAAQYESSVSDHWRIPSISLVDFLDEKKRIESSGQSLRFKDWFMLPFAFTIGVIIDLMQYFLTKGVGEGRWSWALSAIVCSSSIIMKQKPELILSTGGPASAHLAGIIVGKLFRLPIIIELQDPLSGDGIGRNVQARGWLFKVEEFIIRFSDRVVYVTEAAADFARNQFHAKNIRSVYPGAKKFEIEWEAQKMNSQKKFRLVHLGSLYATRNFTSIMSAIDKLVESNKINQQEIELINLGHVAENIRQEIIKKDYVKILPPVSRVEALQYASNSDVTLLIQNSDARSQVTIPYKAYDYLNLTTPLLALLNSDELTRLINQSGHIAVPLDDIEKISNMLFELFENRKRVGKKNPFVEPVEQVKKLLEISPIESGK